MLNLTEVAGVLIEVDSPEGILLELSRRVRDPGFYVSTLSHTALPQLRGCLNYPNLRIFDDEEYKNQYGPVWTVVNGGIRLVEFRENRLDVQVRRVDNEVAVQLVPGINVRVENAIYGVVTYAGFAFPETSIDTTYAVGVANRLGQSDGLRINGQTIADYFNQFYNEAQDVIREVFMKNAEMMNSAVTISVPGTSFIFSVDPQIERSFLRGDGIGSAVLMLVERRIEGRRITTPCQTPTALLTLLQVPFIITIHGGR